MANHNQKLFRWALELQQYTLVIKHRPYSRNWLPDILNRPCCDIYSNFFSDCCYYVHFCMFRLLYSVILSNAHFEHCITFITATYDWNRRNIIIFSSYILMINFALYHDCRYYVHFCMFRVLYSVILSNAHFEHCIAFITATYDWNRRNIIIFSSYILMIILALYHVVDITSLSSNTFVRLYDTWLYRILM